MTINDKLAEAALDWPDISGNYKVLQIMIKGEQRLAYGPETFPHSILLAAVLKKCEIEYSQVPGRSIPAASGDGYRLFGAGNMNLIIIRNRNIYIAKFSGRSEEYGLELNHQHLEMLTERMLEFRIVY